MALTEKQIKEFAVKAESCLSDLSDDQGLASSKEALIYLDKIIKDAAPNAYYFLLRAEAKYRRTSLLGEVNPSPILSALEDISTAIELDPDQAFFYQMRGDILFSMATRYKIGANSNEQLMMVLADYKIAQRKNPISSEVWLNLIAVSILVNDWDEAISFYGQSKPYITDRTDQPIRAWLGCLALVLAGDIISNEDMDPLKDRSSKIAEHDFIQEVLIYVGKTLREKLTTFERDKVDMLNALLLERIENEYTRKLIYSTLGLHNEALNSSQNLLKNEPRSPLAWDNLGNELEALGRDEEALQAFSRAIELAPDYLSAWDDKGRLLWKMDRYGAAIKALVKSKNTKGALIVLLLSPPRAILRGILFLVTLPSSINSRAARIVGRFLQILSIIAFLLIAYYLVRNHVLPKGGIFYIIGTLLFFLYGARFYRIASRRLARNE